MCTTTHLVEWPKSKTMTKPNAYEDVEQELSFIADGNAMWYNHFGRQLSVSYKMKHILKYMILQSHSLVFIYQNEMKTYIHTNTTYVYL